MTVLFVIPTLGTRPEWLETCVRSVRRQSCNADLVLVAPGRANIDSVANKYGARVVREDEPGLSHAINIGFERGLQGHQYFAWLGDDDILAPGSLRATMAALESSKGAVAAYGNARYIDAEGTTRFVLLAVRWAQYYAYFGRSLISQPGSLIKAEAFRRIGCLREDLRNAMDAQMWLALRRCGKVIHVHREVAAYRWHEGSISARKDGWSELEQVQRSMSSARMLPVGQHLARQFLDRLVIRAARAGRQPRVPYVDGRPYTLS
jgi:GT2 family glycosyltransferase